jgi:uroporphyrinogen decarboxylase
MKDPDFNRVRAVLLRSGEPDRVPLGDISVHPILKEKLLGRPIRGLEDEVAFWYEAGFDYVPLEQGLQLTPLIRAYPKTRVELAGSSGEEAQGYGQSL